MTASATAGARRVVAVFDPSTGTATAIEAAVSLAARLGTDLAVVWIDDDRLRGLAELPFVRRVVTGAGAAEAMERGTHDAEVRVLAERVRRELTEAARRHRVSASFATARGSLPNGAAQAAGPADLLLLEGTSRPLPGGGRLPSRARATVERANRDVMLLPHRPNVATGHVQVVREPGGEATLRAAENLARQLGSTLEEVALEHVARALVRAPGGVVVLAATSRWLTMPNAWELLAEARCAAWIVK